MVNFWKVKREMRRVWLQFSDMIKHPFRVYTQIKYDQNFKKLITVIPGNLVLKNMVAIFLVYQPHHFNKSVSSTCKYLTDKGYSVILVSSSPIPMMDKKVLTDYCWKILERPNYGYDFGGYRDGLRIMNETGANPERLLILNDSIWYPLSLSNTLLEKLESEGCSFNSPVFTEYLGNTMKNSFFHSFFFLLKREAFESQTFKSYWNDYRVCSEKRLVLLRGERGFSQAMFNAGFSEGLRSSENIMFERLSQQSNGFLKLTLSYAAYADDFLLATGRELLVSFQDNTVWRDRTLNHMKEAINRTHPLGVFVYASILLLDFSFLKKRSTFDVFDGMRWQYLRAVKNGDLPSPHPDILAEIMASKMDPTLTTDPSIPTPISTTKAK